MKRNETAEPDFVVGAALSLVGVGFHTDAFVVDVEIDDHLPPRS